MIFGLFSALATVTSSAESIIFDGTARRKVPNSAKSMLMPICSTSLTTWEGVMMALLTSPCDSDVSRMMRLTSIL